MALSDGAALLLLSTSIWGVATWYSSYIIQSVSLTRIFATAGIASMIALLLKKKFLARWFPSIPLMMNNMRFPWLMTPLTDYQLPSGLKIWAAPIVWRSPLNRGWCGLTLGVKEICGFPSAV